MNIRKKMISVFILMIFLIVGINTYYLSKTNIQGSDAFTENRFVSMGDILPRNAEQYFAMIDLAFEDLISDPDFLEAFEMLAGSQSLEPVKAQVYQNKMSYTLYHSAIADNFYRVSIYSENGFYMSNHIDRNDSLVSMSEEAQEIILGLSYLPAVKAAPHSRHVIAPHPDSFTLSMEVPVFSVVRSIIVHGQSIGFIEVSAKTAELEQIFRTDNKSVAVSAVFQDGTVLYNTGEYDTDFVNIPLNTYMDYNANDGTPLKVYHSENRWLGLDLYLSQDNSERAAAVTALVARYIRLSAMIGTLAAIAVVFFSVRLTKSIHWLSNKMQSMPVESLVKAEEPPRIDEFVTSPSDTEVYELEKQFNTLVFNLHSATRREIAMRENTTNARLNALQAQINPHFVYNTLNIIAAKGLESGNEEVTDLCSQFAQMLRYSTDTRSKSVFLREDVEHVTNYLMLLKARYEDGLEYEIELPEEMMDIRIPRLTLQPLVENSIVHGFDDGIDVRRIHIQGQIRNTLMLLEIRDNGKGFPTEVLTQLTAAIDSINHHPAQAPESSSHIGLLNTCWRLHHYSKDAPISMELSNDNGAVVKLWIPIQH